MEPKIYFTTNFRRLWSLAEAYALLSSSVVIHPTSEAAMLTYPCLDCIHFLLLFTTTTTNCVGLIEVNGHLGMRWRLRQTIFVTNICMFFHMRWRSWPIGISEEGTGCDFVGTQQILRP